jgi:hypothetical protein
MNHDGIEAINFAEDAEIIMPICMYAGGELIVLPAVN